MADKQPQFFHHVKEVRSQGPPACSSTSSFFEHNARNTVMALVATMDFGQVRLERSLWFSCPAPLIPRITAEQWGGGWVFYLVSE